MKNVLIFKFPYQSNFGGGERHAIKLVEELKKYGLKFYLAGSCSTLLEQFKKRGWPAQKIWAQPEPVSKIALLLFPFLVIPTYLILLSVLIGYRLAKKTKVLICLSLTEKILMTLPAKILGMKVIWIEHVGFDRWLTQNPLKPFFTIGSKMATVVVVSEALKKQLIQLGVQPNRIKVIYNGFDFPKYQNLLPLTKIRSNENFVVGTVCRLEKEKGIEFLLLAAQKAQAMIPELRIIIVGEGNERKKLEWLAKNLQIDRMVQLVGFQKDTLSWIKDFDVFVLPSVFRESFGQTLVQALALERPVIASAIEGIPEIVLPQQTGLLVEPGKPDEIAQGLILLYQQPDLARQLAVNGRAYVEERFPLKSMINDFFQLLK